MSKAFTKEEVAQDAPVVGRLRAPLPEGATNYVTPGGLADLRAELARLEHERAGIDGSSDAARALTSRITDVAARIGSAVVVEPPENPGDEVRFGAFVTVRDGEGAERQVQIVGVDEADAAAGKVAFVSPVARALLGRRVGDIAVVTSPRGEDELAIVAVRYAPRSQGS